jgi:AcrR family transcriptional regulator
VTRSPPDDAARSARQQGRRRQAATPESRQADTGRDHLLARAVSYFASNGIADTSLRHLAEQIGTSHRMLLYHFGSREGLLAAVVGQVESEQRAHLMALLAETVEDGADLVSQGLRFWHSVTDAALIYGPLFFELSSHAMQGLPHAARLRPGLVESWLDPLAAGWLLLGLSPDDARRQARLDLAVARGLLHDLLLTGDRAGVDAAMHRYLQQATATVTGPSGFHH